MPEFAQGLRLAVTDRDEFEQFIDDEAHDPGVHYDSWGNNSVPSAIYIQRYHHADEYYNCLNEHVNGVVATHAYGKELIDSMLSAGVIENTNEYDVEFVQENK